MGFCFDEGAPAEIAMRPLLMNKDRTYQLLVSHLAIDVVKKKIKNMHLKVYPAGRVRISAPLRVKDEAIRRLKFIRQVPESKPEYVSGESHYFLGKPYLLKVLYHDAPPKVDISNESHILLYVREGSDLERRESVMREWYRAKLKEVAPPLIEKWQKVIGVQVRDWGVKKMKTRWGSCNVKARRVWLNLELAKKPLHCLDFITLYEMIHFLERTHSHQFNSSLPITKRLTRLIVLNKRRPTVGQIPRRPKRAPKNESV